MAKPPPPPAKTTVSTPSANTNAKGEAPAPMAVVHNLKKPQAGDLKPLNFKVDPEFHRQFKAFAASHGISMVDLLREGFYLVKEHWGEP
jgi:hypothetical protein